MNNVIGTTVESTVLFNVNMTSSEARMALYAACDGKTKEERKHIIDEYTLISRIIFDRELDLAREGWLMC